MTPADTLPLTPAQPAPVVPMVPMAPMAPTVLTALALLCALPSTGAQAQDIAAGRQKAQACAVCHGPLGLSQAPDAPNLAGQPALYVAAQLRAYRSGARKHEVMAVMAKPLTDDDISNLSAWFASLRVDVRPPP